MAIITISRQAGSLGDEIARRLSEEMDYRLVGRNDFRDLAAKYNDQFNGDLTTIASEQGPGLWQRLMLSTPVFTSLYEAFIFELASQRQVIILGRGAQIVLRDVHQVYRCRVVAPTHARVIHLRQVHGMTTDEAIDFIRSHDKKRRDLVRQIYERDPRDWALYDMILNTERIDVEAGVTMVKSAVGELKRLQPLEEAGQVLQNLALGKRVEALIRQRISPTRDIEAFGETGGVITLVGSAPSAEDVDRAERIAMEFEDVTEVKNQIKPPAFVAGY